MAQLTAAITVNIHPYYLEQIGEATCEYGHRAYVFGVFWRGQRLLLQVSYTPADDEIWVSPLIHVRGTSYTTAPKVLCKQCLPSTLKATIDSFAGRF